MTGPVLEPAALAVTTDADRRAQLDGGVPVACGACGGLVLAAKRSPEHTSIQWTADATRHCRAYTATDGCPHLRATLDATVADNHCLAPGDGCLLPWDEVVARGG